MRAGQFKCRHCGRMGVEKRKGQKYCGLKECQASRKREWNRTKYANDPDYRATQRESTAAWLSSQGGAVQYHREYRRRLRESATLASGNTKSANAATQGERERSDFSPSVVKRGGVASLFAGNTLGIDANANRDARSGETHIKTGIYKICPAGANKDAILVELRVITG
jgi:hypothetical protein